MQVGRAVRRSTSIIRKDSHLRQTPTNPTPQTPQTGGTEGGGICEIDPSACPKAADIGEAAKKEYKKEIYAVEQIYVLRYHRVELTPYWGFTLNDQFVNHTGPGLNANFYITNVFAVGLNGNFYSGLNSDSDFNFQTRRASRIAVPLTEYSWSAALNFTYVPVYGKFAGFGGFIFSYDLYATGGVGAISTRPIPVIDPDNRKFDFDPKVGLQPRHRPSHLRHAVARRHGRDSRLHLSGEARGPQHRPRRGRCRDGSELQELSDEPGDVASRRQSTSPTTSKRTSA